jgi:hypothetical protein
MTNFIMKINSQQQKQQPKKKVETQPVLIKQEPKQTLILGSLGTRNCATLKLKGSVKCGSCGNK